MSKEEQLRDEEPRVVVRDKRRIDPESGEVRPVAAPAAPDDPGGFAPATDPAASAAGQRGAADEGLLATIDERTAICSD
jgi:molecular chaperone GrpE